MLQGLEISCKTCLFLNILNGDLYIAALNAELFYISLLAS